MKMAVEKIQIYGLRKFTMDEIASELKISKKTIYKYYKSKEDIILEYINTIIESDKKYTLNALEESDLLEDKLHSIIYSYHKYKLPVSILDEIHKFYYKQWEKIQELKTFKINIIEDVLKKSIDDGMIKNDINLHLISTTLESVSNTFLDYKFLSDNNLTLKDAMNEVIKILLYGILK